MDRANRFGVKVALSYSDPFLMDRFPDDFLRVTEEYCDVVFCNADEARKLMERDDLSAAALELGKLVELAFITDGPRGCLVVRSDQIEHVLGFDVDAVDTVGAGDAFAGGVLYGLTHNFGPVQAARWGNYMASRVVTVHGARLTHNVAHEVAQVVGIDDAESSTMQN